MCGCGGGGVGWRRAEAVELVALPNLFSWTLEPREVALGTVSDAISFRQEAGAVSEGTTPCELHSSP